MKRSRCVPALWAAVAVVAAGCGTEFSATSFLNKVPPEFPTAGTWLNADDSLQLSDLNGQLVWLEFGFLH